MSHGDSPVTPQGELAWPDHQRNTLFPGENATVVFKLANGATVRLWLAEGGKEIRVVSDVAGLTVQPRMTNSVSLSVREKKR